MTDTDKMTLLEMGQMPPGGYQYFEPELNWRNPDPLHGEGISHAAKLLQMVRAQNHDAHPELDPSYSACLEAIKQFTCTRLNYDPRWCGLPPKEAQIVNSRAHAQVGRRCAGCGRR